MRRITIGHPLFAKAFLLAACLILLPFHAAVSMEYVSCAGVSIYYPKGEEEIAKRLEQNTPGFLSFLERKGLPVTLPVHVVLDEELDDPDAYVEMLPHREIRIPLRAPGVLEDGYLEGDPWSYFYFKGLCLQGIYAMRSGIPSGAHRVFGEISSPNLILPPWLTEGICRVLYCSCTGAPLLDPFSKALLRTSVPEDISRASNHPDKWPGYYTCRIWGIPFTSWLDRRYGWDRLHEFLSVHGRGIIPIELDLKAEKVYGKSWQALWSEFVAETAHTVDESGSGESMTADGYWPDPLTYWNASGIYPGTKSTRLRGRYGYVDPDGTLWISEYSNSGSSGLAGYRRGTAVRPGGGHVWDPAPGGIAVSRKGSKPSLVFFTLRETIFGTEMIISRRIPGPPGAIQISGPAMSRKGTLAVSANTGGNWDIWVYDGCWKRITSSAGIELDPWWEGESLVFSSDISGTFQIHRLDLSQVTTSELCAVMPRGDSYLSLESTGWSVERYEVKQLPSAMPEASAAVPGQVHPVLDTKPYSPWPSILPDFIAPDLYIGPSDVQAGLVTWGKDVSGDYSVRTGFRYSFNLDYLSLEAGSTVKDVGLSYTRYPLSYDPENAPSTEESRNEIGLSYSPSGLGWASLSLNRLAYEPLDDPGPSEDELWAALSLGRQFKTFTPNITAETYSGGRKSLFGSLRFVYGSEVFLALHLLAGRSWGETWPGHGTFRVGGDIGEGYFTRRPSRLFPLRGFSPNILESDRAVTSSTEVYFPLANLQMGRRTLPLYFHRLSLGTFVDAGACSERLSKDQLLVGAGFELITSMEIAWGNLSVFKLGVAWPVDQPDGLDEKGPTVILQVGKPL